MFDVDAIHSLLSIDENTAKSIILKSKIPKQLVPNINAISNCINHSNLPTQIEILEKIDQILTNSIINPKSEVEKYCDNDGFCLAEKIRSAIFSSVKGEIPIFYLFSSQYVSPVLMTGKEKEFAINYWLKNKKIPFPCEFTKNRFEIKKKLKRLIREKYQGKYSFITTHDYTNTKYLTATIQPPYHCTPVYIEIFEKQWSILISDSLPCKNIGILWIKKSLKTFLKLRKIKHQIFTIEIDRQANSYSCFFNSMHDLKQIGKIDNIFERIQTIKSKIDYLPSSMMKFCQIGKTLQDYASNYPDEENLSSLQEQFKRFKRERIVLYYDRCEIKKKVQQHNVKTLIKMYHFHMEVIKEYMSEQTV